MSAELFKALTHVDMIHVPYRGSAIAYPDLISNKVQVLFDNLPGALEQVRAGNHARAWCHLAAALARRAGVSGDRRDRAGPSSRLVSTASPRRKAPRRRLWKSSTRRSDEALKDPKLVARLAEIGGIPKPMTPAEFGKLVTDETEKWRKVVEFAGVSVD